MRDTITNFIIAGRDTTASTLSWSMLILSKYPIFYNKIKKEIKDIIGDEEITPQKIKKMYYLRGFITEVLRLYPPVPQDTKICVTNNIKLPSNYIINKGDIIVYNPLLMGHCDFIWDNPENIIPERHFNNEPSQYKFPVFNAGYRLCLGKEMAYLEISIFLIKLIQNFSFELISKDIKQVVRITLNIQDQLLIKFI